MAAAPHDRHAPQKARDAAVRIVRRLRENGHEAYLAGGCVRDELLGLSPKDFDVATDAPPERVQELFPRSNAVGAAFGVVLVNEGPKRARVTTEIATFREDGAYSDSRRPDAVTFSNARSDAQRRDFTVNALFLDPLDESGTGRVIDFVGGQDDLKRKVIRAVGNPEARLAEDHLRALRAVRFTCRLGFELETGTANAVRAHAADLKGVSRERIGDEVRRMLSHPSRAVAAELFGRLGIDGPIVDGAPQPDQNVDLLRSLPPDANATLAIAAWGLDRGTDLDQHDARQAWVQQARRALCLSNEERDTVSGILETAGVVRAGWLDAPVHDQKRIASRATFGGSMIILARLNPELLERVEQRVSELASDGIGLTPKPLIDGETLIRLGIPTGPAYTTILNGVYDAQLRGDISEVSRAEALAMELAGPSGV